MFFSPFIALPLALAGRQDIDVFTDGTVFTDIYMNSRMELSVH
jgi:hypothetical protein